MQILGFLGFVALIVASFAVGFRLLWLGSRTRQLPELMIGGAFIWAGGVPGLLLILSDDGSGNGPIAQGGLVAATSLSFLLGVSMLAYFTWRVFRPTERWGAALFGCLVTGLVAGYAGSAAAAFGGSARVTSLVGVGLAFKVAAYTWAFVEATRECLAARRRCAIGLTDPLVANRMLLWSIGLGAVLAIWLHEAATMVLGRDGNSYLLIAVLGFVCAGALWLAFFPPAMYQRRFAAADGAAR